MYMRGIVWSQFSVFAACEQPTASTAVSRLEDSAVFSLFSYLRIPHVLLTPLACENGAAATDLAGSSYGSSKS